MGHRTVKEIGYFRRVIKLGSHLWILFLLFGCKTTSILNSMRPSDYDPTNPGSKWIYLFVESYETLTVTIDTIEKIIDRKKYFKVNRSFSCGDNSESYKRIENDVVYVFSVRTNVESIEIPSQIKKGVSWIEGDGSWSYKIISTNASIVTPIASYDSLLQVKATQLKGRDEEKFKEYNLFYRRGVGLVATKGNDKLMTYLKHYELR